MLKQIFALLFFSLLLCPLFSENKTIHEIPVLTQEEQNQIHKIMQEVEQFWCDQHGFMRLTPTEESFPSLDNENPVLFTSEYFYLLWRLGILKGSIQDAFLSKIREMIAKLRLEPGLFNRYPGQTSDAFHRHFSRDEQIGLVTLDMVFDWKLGFAKELHAYGQKNHYMYMNQNWSGPGEHNRPVYDDNGKEIPLWKIQIVSQRMPECIEYIRMAAGRNPEEISQKLFQIALELTGEKEAAETSGKLLAYLRIEVMYGKVLESNQCIERFLLKMRKMYGENPYHQIAKIYFLHSEHPIRRLSAFLKK